MTPFIINNLKILKNMSAKLKAGNVVKKAVAKQTAKRRKPVKPADKPSSGLLAEKIIEAVNEKNKKK